MSEHAFDPIPDEEQEGATTATAGTEWIPSDADVPPEPNATVTLDSVFAAIAAKRWEHENASIALWLNTSFPITTEDADAIVAQLNAYGIAVI